MSNKKIKYYKKYQANGNDFIIFSDELDKNFLSKKIEFPENEIKKLCNRHFGIGADGFIILRKHKDFDFYFEFYNSDGSRASMCGNGARAAVAEADSKLKKTEYNFIADDGIHHAKILKNKQISISIKNVNDYKIFEDGYFIDTGVPHFVIFVNNISELNVNELGKQISNERRFIPERTNVNFVEKQNENYYISTFERGVEAETLSCGTGTVAAAIAINLKENDNTKNYHIISKGGSLFVDFEKNDNSFINIYLSGAVTKVFDTKL